MPRPQSKGLFRASRLNANGRGSNLILKAENSTALPFNLEASFVVTSQNCPRSNKNLNEEKFDNSWVAVSEQFPLLGRLPECPQLT